jgi:hypothetical protein
MTNTTHSAITTYSHMLMTYVCVHLHCGYT